MAVANQFPHTCWSQPDAELVVLDFLRNTDAHHFSKTSFQFRQTLIQGIDDVINIALGRDQRRDERDHV